jgi:peptidoglycan/LPS O-acetylase OafA/YrhL
LPDFGLRSLQQTFLCVALCALIAAASVGFTGWLKWVLEHPFFQRVGALSYGVYLFHNLAPLATGKIMPFFWWGHFDKGPAVLLKIAAYAGVTWILTLASWRWIENPLQDMRARMRPASRGKPASAGTDAAS